MQRRYYSVEVSEEQYRDAVEQLLRVSRFGSHSSKAAAALLLNLYNGFNFRTNLLDLESLDSNNFEAAICAIRGRRQLYIEPHHLFENGHEIFTALVSEWEELRLTE